MSLAPGSYLGPYEIVEQIGAGGMGVVFRARDRRLERDVAIKVLPLGALSEGAQARFRKEALALAKVSQPNIATLYDVGEQDGVSYIVMECVAGQSLAARLEAGPLPVGDVVRLGVEIATALEEAHEHGIVHRDLKPANVMVTPKGHAKVLDFGIAKLLAPDRSSVAQSTETQGVVGTLLYMSPEQASGETVDVRTDLWSLGVLLYESITGAPPFQGAGTLGILHAITQSVPEPMRARRLEVPPELERVVTRALSKDASLRYQSASEMSGDLAGVLAQLSAPQTSPQGARRFTSAALVPALLAIILAASAGTWFYQRSEKRHWARGQAVLESAKLQAVDKTLAAFLMIRDAQQILPADSQITALVAEMSSDVSIASSPPGATVEIQDYTATDSGWHHVGTTPVAKAILPNGYFRWRLTSAALGSFVTAPVLHSTMRFALDSARAAPPGMVYATGSTWGGFIAFVGWVGPYDLPPFYIDKYEVSNRDYQQFVDAGGYDRREYWTEGFVDAGRGLPLAEAMARFRDSTGRPGPSTWKAGHYAEGRGDYPVQGVSWYEASAYAVYAGKTLPVMAQWYYAAPPDVAGLTVQASNISKEHVAPVGAFKGVGPFGTYDMAGNVREWVANPVHADRRLILGGAWSSETYLYSEPEALSAFDRSATNGLRCVRNLRPPPVAALAAIKPLERDFSKVTPASDAVFHAYEVMYAYDHTPLTAKVERVMDETSDWREERVTFNTAYGHERMAAYLFIPKHVRAPYATIVFFPSARVIDLTNSQSLGDVSFFDYIVQSGRAVLYPVYQDTYERRVRTVLPGASQEMTLTVQRFKDLARSIDYLYTRADIDTTKLGYLGVSMGAAEGVIYTTLLQDKLKTDVFLDGGYFLDKPSAGRDQADFAPRLKIPVLMVNGRYDFSFSLERAQTPLFRMLGAVAADKRHVVLDTPHDVRAKRPELVKEVLSWLDKYLGAVR
ncbi:MAG: bifunctional serine/threonine-protein kinase/formylglycine-generating enzyme family protein [bacterium]